MSSMSNLEKQSIEKQFVIDALAEDSWRMFKIMGEFVNGFEEMADVGKAVTIFGSARFKPDNPYYQQATDLARTTRRVRLRGDYRRWPWHHGSGQ